MRTPRRATGRPAPAASAPLARYLTLGGAQVHLTPYGHPASPHTRRWACTGCGDTRTGTEVFAKSEASDHAGQCRAMPRETGER